MRTHFELIEFNIIKCFEREQEYLLNWLRLAKFSIMYKFNNIQIQIPAVQKMEKLRLHSILRLSLKIK